MGMFDGAIFHDTDFAGATFGPGLTNPVFILRHMETGEVAIRGPKISDGPWKVLGGPFANGDEAIGIARAKGWM